MDRRSFVKATTLGAAGRGDGLRDGRWSERRLCPGRCRQLYRGGSSPATGEYRPRPPSHPACLRKHLVTNYLPAQCCYNLGEYPAEKPWTSGPTTPRNSSGSRDHGIQLIQLFDEWNDSLRLFGGDKYTPAHPAELRRFVEMAHRRGMKVIPYASSCFLDYRDPDFRPEWSRQGRQVRGRHVEHGPLLAGQSRLAGLSAAAPGPDAGRVRRGRALHRRRLREQRPSKSARQGQPAAPTHDRRGPGLRGDRRSIDGAFTDLLALIYAEVKRRGGMLKLHIGGADQPHSGGLKVYDYLWVGEGVQQRRPAARGGEELRALRRAVHRLHLREDRRATTSPICTPSPTCSSRCSRRANPTPASGRVPRLTAPDKTISGCAAAGRSGSTIAPIPRGRTAYGRWDAVPGRPETRPTHARWLQAVPAAGGRRDLGVAGGPPVDLVLPTASAAGRGIGVCQSPACTWCWPTTARKPSSSRPPTAMLPAARPARRCTAMVAPQAIPGNLAANVMKVTTSCRNPREPLQDRRRKESVAMEKPMSERPILRLGALGVAALLSCVGDAMAFHNSLWIRDSLRQANSDPVYKERRDPHRGVCRDPKATPGASDFEMKGRWRVEAQVPQECVAAAAGRRDRFPAPHGGGGVRDRPTANPLADRQGLGAARLSASIAIPARSRSTAAMRPDSGRAWPGGSARCACGAARSCRAARSSGRRRGRPRSARDRGAATTRCPTSRRSISATTPSGSTPITASTA